MEPKCMDDSEADILLKNALRSDFVPDCELDSRIIQKAEERESMGVKRIRKIPVLIIVCCALLFCSVTAFAAWRFLAPKDIAMEYGDKQLAEAFESEDAVLMEESQTYGDYTVTLLGTVSGRSITDFVTEGDEVSPDRTYAVVAISRTDGTSMPDTSSNEYGRTPFLVSPLVQGLNPRKYNIVTMHGGYSEIIKYGIMYRMIECDNVEIFADRKVYLCVTNTVFYDNNAYVFNEDTGEITVNSEYDGMNLLFDLPLNKDKADKEAAGQYLEGSGNALYQEDETDAADKVAVREETDVIDKAILQEEKDTKDAEPVDIVKEILDNWTFASEQKLTPDKEGKVYYSFKKKNGGISSGIIVVDALFAEDETGYSKDVWRTSADGEFFNAFLTYKDENGDIIVSMYEKNE